MRTFRRTRLGRHDELTCKEVGRVLQAYLDVELDADAARRVSAHLATCRRCGLDLEAFTEIKAALARTGGAGDDGPALGRLLAFAAELAAGDGAGI